MTNVHHRHWGKSDQDDLLDCKLGSLLSANHLVLVELPGQNLQRGLNDASPKPQHQMQS